MVFEYNIRYMQTIERGANYSMTIGERIQDLRKKMAIHKRNCPLI